MGGLIKPLRKFSKKTDPLYELNAGAQIGESLSPDMPDIPAPLPPPSIDDAQKNRQEQDRLRRRKGVLANIYGGAGSAAPSVGQKTLLGG
jgi:hypothetical protein